jgi:alpha-glucosidase
MKNCLLLILTLLFAGAALAQSRPSTAGPGVHVLAPALPMPALARERTIRVYLPPSYGKGHRHYPVLYMHDGQNLFDDATSFVGEWGVDESMDALARTQGLEVIVVGIDHGQDKRISELSPWANPKYGIAEGRQYVDFVVGTVKPYIDEHYRTRRGRKDTGIMGSSLGAMSSQYAIYQYPKVFGRAGIFSPSYWFADEVYAFTAARHLPPGTRLYLVAGDSEGDEPQATVANVRQMERVLRASGDRKVALQVAIRAGAGHNEKFWRSEFPQAMQFLFGKR